MTLSSTLDTFLNQDALVVTRSNFSLHDATPTSSPLTIGTAPIVPFRCKVTLLSVAGHTTCAGTITIGLEAMTFTVAGTKTTTTTLNAKPIVTYATLDCHIHITAVDVNGNDLKSESTTAIDVRWEDYTKLWQGATGSFSQTDTRFFTDSTMPVVGSIVRYDRANPTSPTNGADYVVVQMKSRYDKKGTFIFKTLYI